MNRRTDELESALKAIWTWASYDEVNGCQRALLPRDVMRLCDRVLRIKKHTPPRYDDVCAEGMAWLDEPE